jgi:hypothetical protein
LALPFDAVERRLIEIVIQMAEADRAALPSG